MPAIAYLRLSELAEHIEDVINDSFYQSTFWVLADVIDYKVHEQKGHHYFCLAEKDPQTHSVVAKLQAAAWKNGGALSIAAFEQVTGQKFRSNIHVLANVSVQYTPAYGLKLILNEVDPTYTIGILEQHRRDMLQKLVTLCPDYVQLIDGVYHTRNKSLELPPVLKRIAVITSAGAEGYRDFRDTIEHNRFGYAIELDTWFTSVQGEANAEGLSRQLVDIFQSKKPYDAVVIIRGGGSQADLLLFEQFTLARAVAKFPIPIITGIGHHINQSIVDLMAHTSVKTPSIAAEFIIAHNRQFEEEVLLMQQGVAFRAQQVMAQWQRELSALTASAVHSGRKMIYDQQAILNEVMGALLVRPVIRLAAQRCELDSALRRLKSGARRMLSLQKGSIDHHMALTRILNPVNILKRGFAVVYRGADIVTDAEGIEPAAEISIRFHDAKLGAIITSKTTLDGSIANL